MSAQDAVVIHVFDMEAWRPVMEAAATHAHKHFPRPALNETIGEMMGRHASYKNAQTHPAGFFEPGEALSTEGDRRDANVFSCFFLWVFCASRFLQQSIFNNDSPYQKELSPPGFENEHHKHSVLLFPFFPLPRM